jgi:hypothetical protein
MALFLSQSNPSPSKRRETMSSRLDLKVAILEKYRTQTDFAIAVHMGETKVSRVIRGRATLSEGEAERWRIALDCKPSLIESVIGNKGAVSP